MTAMRCVLFLAFPLILAAAPRPLVACQCGDRPTLAEATARAQVIFAGEVFRVDSTEVDLRIGDSSVRTPVKEVTLIARRRWKGEVEHEMKLIVGASNCDYPFFKVGETYLVYGGASSFLPSRLGASRCSRTDYFRHAKEDVSGLGRGAPVVSTSGEMKH
jgi:hypothetical protein